MMLKTINAYLRNREVFVELVTRNLSCWDVVAFRMTARQDYICFKP